MCGTTIKKRFHPLIIMLLALLLPATAYADGTISVNTLDDEFGEATEATCSLREAIEAVNIHNAFGGCQLNGTPPYTIELEAGTYTLTRAGNNEDRNSSGDLDILAPLLITGVDAEATIIQAGPDAESAVDRVLHILPTAEVSLSGITIQHGVTDGSGNGGGIANFGSLLLDESVLTMNTSLGDGPGLGGGGIFNGPNSNATLSNSKIISNVALSDAGNGGGLLNAPNAILTINNSLIADNSTARAGGGIENDGGYVTLNEVSLNNNLAGINGGGLHISGAGAVHMLGGEVMDNAAASEGGGLWNSAIGTLIVEKALVTGNAASGDDADQGGGGIFNDGGSMTITDSDITANVADGASGSGGGILATVGSRLYINGGAVSENSSIRAGGGIEINGSDEMPVQAIINDVELNGNVAGSAPGNGGALHITGSAFVEVKNATVSNNLAAAEGGGLWNSAVGTLMVIETTLTSNTASGSAPDQGGGALFNDGGMITISSSIIEGNSADGDSGSGGGLLSTPGSNISIYNTRFSENRANRAGGGIEVAGSAEEKTAAMITNVSLINNESGPMPGNGGALHITGQAEVKFNDGIVLGNRAAAEGGGFWNSAAGTLTVNNAWMDLNVASGDDADQGGGALFNDGGMLTISQVRLMNNQADGASGSGGGLLAGPGSTLEINGGTIISNTANRAGGGIEINATITDSVTAALNGVMLNENLAGAAPGNGGALHITGPADTTINGGAVMQNMASAEGGGLWNSAEGILMIDGTTIKGNIASGAEASQGGGGLYNDGGTIMLNNAIVRGNKADGPSGSGGGIFNNMGTLTVMDSTIAGNSANRAGGGIEDNVGTLVMLDRVRLLKNEAGSAPGNGGGLHISGAGTVDIMNSTVAENSASAEGGGLWNSGAGTLNVIATTFNKNTALSDADSQGGGALFNDGGEMTVSNSTLTGNMAVNGAGLFNAAGSSDMTNVTIYANDGSGIANDSGTVNLINSIVASNSADCIGAIMTNDASNLDGDGSCGASISADPMLEGLASGDGSNATLALLEESPALDAGDDSICGADVFTRMDQRGALRPQGGGCDLGAYELGNRMLADGLDLEVDDIAEEATDDRIAQECPGVSGNILVNGGFENELTPWTLFTDDASTYALQEGAAECMMAAVVSIDEDRSSTQLYQNGLTLTADTTYRLSYMAYSSTGSDMTIYIHDDVPPYENYGLTIGQVDLSQEWSRYSVEFTTRNFTDVVENARLRFWFKQHSNAGDLYVIDDVRLEVIDGNESNLAVTE